MYFPKEKASKRRYINISEKVCKYIFILLVIRNLSLAGKQYNSYKIRTDSYIDEKHSQKRKNIF